MPGDLLTQLEGSVESMVSRIGRTLEDRAERAATSVGTMIVLALVAGLSVVGLLAAAVVALAQPLGVAGALAVVNGCSLLVCGAVWTLRRRATRRLEPPKEPEPAAHTAVPTPAATEAPGPAAPKVDPWFVAASATAAIALIGPRRLVRAAAFAADGLRAAESLLLALDLASHAASVKSILNDLTRGHTPPPPPPPPAPPVPPPPPTPPISHSTLDPVEPSPSGHLAGLD